jgi:hypothetical protein
MKHHMSKQEKEDMEMVMPGELITRAELALEITSTLPVNVCQWPSPTYLHIHAKSPVSVAAGASQHR